jgi:hypothetical protein
MVAAHSTGQLSAHHGPALVDLDRVLTAAERVLNDALHLEKITLAHLVSESKIFGKKAARKLAQPERERKMAHDPGFVQRQ